MDLAKAHYQLGIRIEGPALHHHLAAAVTAYRAALEIYTRALFPQDWAGTQNGLGSALRGLDNFSVCTCTLRLRYARKKPVF